METFSKPFSRRTFLTGTSSMGALFAATSLAPLPALAEALADDPRIAKQPIADKGFASVRKIGDGLYATIADRSKGLQARCNGGFLIGRDAAIMIEGFQTGHVAHGHAIAVARGNQYALALRSYPGKFGLWRGGNPDLGARRRSLAHDRGLP